MKAFYLIVLLISCHSFAALEKVHIEGLNLNYKAPHGEGTILKVGIGTSLEPHPLIVDRTDEGFSITSVYLDFLWQNPPEFLVKEEIAIFKNTNVHLGKLKHSVKSDSFEFGKYKATEILGSCEGTSIKELPDRLFEDCLSQMRLTIKKVDFPDEFFLYRLVEAMPDQKPTEAEMPGDHVILNIDKSEFAFQMYIKYWVYAGLRAWGHAEIQDDGKTFAIKVDQIKFGYITVTNLVMDKLKEMIKNPNVKVDPPWIRINRTK